MNRRVILDQFPTNQSLGPAWKTFVKGNGLLDFRGDTLLLENRDTVEGEYTNAQLDDYQHLARSDFLWRPPLQMVVTARFSHPAGALKGTAGFGFWNDPFMMTGARRPALPRVVWFFYSSEPSNMKLDLQTPGHGWKAATLDALRWPFFALLPTAPVAVPLMNVGFLYRMFWPIGQRAINVSEALIPAAMTDWHTYTLHWGRSTVRFEVDGQMILACPTSPRGPLGFVLWLDNQYMVVTPWGRFGYGLINAPGRQWMEVRHVEIATRT